MWKCEVNGVECIGVDLVTGREIPRSYIVHLEERVKFLEENYDYKIDQVLLMKVLVVHHLAAVLLKE